MKIKGGWNVRYYGNIESDGSCNMVPLDFLGPESSKSTEKNLNIQKIQKSASTDRFRNNGLKLSFCLIKGSNLSVDF